MEKLEKNWKLENEQNVEKIGKLENEMGEIEKKFEKLKKKNIICEKRAKIRINWKIEEKVEKIEKVER